MYSIFTVILCFTVKCLSHNVLMSQLAGVSFKVTEIKTLWILILPEALVQLKADKIQLWHIHLTTLLLS